MKVTVLCGLPKGDKTDYIIQKSVEAGAEEILFFNSDRCVARPDKPEKKLERWRPHRRKRPRSSPDAGLSRRSAGRAISQARWTLQ